MRSPQLSKMRRKRKLVFKSNSFIDLGLDSGSDLLEEIDICSKDLTFTDSEDIEGFDYSADEYYLRYINDTLFENPSIKSAIDSSIGSPPKSPNALDTYLKEFISEEVMGNNISKKTSENPSEKTSEKSSEKTSEKPLEKTSEKALDMPSDKPPVMSLDMPSTSGLSKASLKKAIENKVEVSSDCYSGDMSSESSNIWSSTPTKKSKGIKSKGIKSKGRGRGRPPILDPKIKELHKKESQIKASNKYRVKQRLKDTNIEELLNQNLIENQKLRNQLSLMATYYDQWVDICKRLPLTDRDRKRLVKSEKTVDGIKHSPPISLMIPFDKK